jgi:hypothetical protein
MSLLSELHQVWYAVLTKGMWTFSEAFPTLPLLWANFAGDLPSPLLPGKECVMQNSLDQAVPRQDLVVVRGQFPRDHLKIEFI